MYVARFVSRHFALLNRHSDIDQTAGFEEEAARVLRRRTWTGMSHILLYAIDADSTSFNRTDYMFKVGFQLEIKKL